jgi:hypothetical protein
MVGVKASGFILPRDIVPHDVTNAGLATAAFESVTVAICA